MNFVFLRFCSSLCGHVSLFAHVSFFFFFIYMGTPVRRGRQTYMCKSVWSLKVGIQSISQLLTTLNTKRGFVSQFIPELIDRYGRSEQSTCSRGSFVSDFWIDSHVDSGNLNLDAQTYTIKTLPFGSILQPPRAKDCTWNKLYCL